jgi:hypothetical protein
MNNILCPKCNKSYYRRGITSITAMYFEPIFKDGVNINPDKNIVSTEIHCLSCGHDFKHQSYSYENK